MGHIRHHAIVVTSFGKEYIEEAQKKAIEMFANLVSPIIESNINGYVSFFVAPDGSKEGWEPSDEGDIKRKDFIDFFESQGEDCMCTYCEVLYGDEEGHSAVINHN